MAVVYLTLYLVSAVCFALSAVPVAQSRPALLPAGLLAWVMVPLLHTALSLH